MKFILIICFMLSPVLYASQEQEFAGKISAACKLPITFSLHDYQYGRDEASLYSSLHFEDCTLLSSQITRFCEKNSANKIKASKIKKVACQRGSLEERKLILRKDGTLVYLIARDPKETLDRGTLVKNDLEKVIGFTDDLDPVKEAPAEVKKPVTVKNPDSQEIAAKVKTLTEWFRGEVKKITTSGDPDMAKKLEKLSETYKEKVNALTHRP